MATITSHYAQAALLGAERQGIETHKLLQQAGIANELITTQNTRVHEDQLSRLIRLVWDTLEDEFMGFTAHKCKQGSFAMMCELVSHCNTLEGLFKRAIEFYYLITEDIVMQFEYYQDNVKFSIKMSDPTLDPDHFYLEFWMVIWHRFASWITGCQLPLKRANFHYSVPKHIEEFQFLFPCDSHFNQSETSLVFSQRYLQKPLIKTQRELAYFLKSSPACLMTIPNNDNSIRLQIKHILLQSAKDIVTFPSFETVSNTLNTSPQTLRRTLKAEGTSYQRIKDAIRRDLAIEKLHVHNIPINDVAASLGFAEARSFSRAFKQWTGVSPSSYRQIT